MEHVYASMDIGSDTIKIVVCELNRNHLNLLAATSTEAYGIKKDLIYKPEEAIKSIKKALDEIQLMLGVRLTNVITTIPSHNIDYKIVKDQVKINGDLIEASDIASVYQKSISNNLTSDKEFVNLIPIDFKINNKSVTDNPKGFPGDELFGRSMMITSPKKNIYSVATILEDIGLEIEDVSVASIGDIYAFKDKTTESQIGAIINIGSDITTVNLYNKDIPVNTRIVTMGGKDIDDDLAFMYKISTGEAKKIKETFAIANDKKANKQDYYEIEDSTGIKVKLNQKEVSAIVKARIEEILELSLKEIKELTQRNIGYVIITGGVSNCSNIESVAEEIFGPIASVGKLKIIGVRNNKYSVALGNLLYYIEKINILDRDVTMLSEEDMEMLSSPNKQRSIANDTMLGKVFGYFFGE